MCIWFWLSVTAKEMSVNGYGSSSSEAELWFPGKSHFGWTHTKSESWNCELETAKTVFMFWTPTSVAKAWSRHWETPLWACLGLGHRGVWETLPMGAFPSQVWDWETLLISNLSQGAHHSQFQMISTRHIMINTLENQFYERYLCHQPMDKGCSHG